jgi:light-regulated signal transduction histidine kinase (bacteriophytochrome)
MRRRGMHRRPLPRGHHPLPFVRRMGCALAAVIALAAIGASTQGRDSQGSGLGLATARDLVRAHGGTIGAASEVGKGTTCRCRCRADRGAHL